MEIIKILLKLVCIITILTQGPAWANLLAMPETSDDTLRPVAAGNLDSSISDEFYVSEKTWEVLRILKHEISRPHFRRLVKKLLTHINRPLPGHLYMIISDTESKDLQGQIASCIMYFHPRWLWHASGLLLTKDGFYQIKSPYHKSMVDFTNFVVTKDLLSGTKVNKDLISFFKEHNIPPWLKFEPGGIEIREDKQGRRLAREDFNMHRNYLDMDNEIAEQFTSRFISKEREEGKLLALIHIHVETGIFPSGKDIREFVQKGEFVSYIIINEKGKAMLYIPHCPLKETDVLQLADLLDSSPEDTREMAEMLKKYYFMAAVDFNEKTRGEFTISACRKFLIPSQSIHLAVSSSA